MEFIFKIVSVPLSYVLNALAVITGNNFAMAIAIFTVFVNLCMVPLSIKSQKSSVSQMRIKPKMEELKKKYGDDKQRYSQEMQKLYQEENISMGGGCLPLIIRMIFMLSVYYLIRSPLTYLMGNGADVVKEAMATAGVTEEIALLQLVQKNPAAYSGINITDINFTLFGINLTQTPVFGWNVTQAWQNIWLIPILAFAAQMATSVISMAMQKKLNPDAPSMAGMMLTMPLLTLFIGFSVPGAVGFYWMCSSVIGSGIQFAVQAFYGPQKMLAKERAKDIVKVFEEEKKYIDKRVAEDTAQ